MGLAICEYAKLRQTLPWFNETINEMEDALMAKAKKDWHNLSFGGIKPTSGQFGKTSVMPELFADMSGSTMATWDNLLTATGHQTIMQGSGSGGRIYEDYKVGLAGLAFLDKATRVSEVKMQISDKKLPRINIEEALAYEKPAVVFEDYFILDEETAFHLYALINTPGQMKIKPIGLQLNRVPNKLQVSDTGAALT